MNEATLGTLIALTLPLLGTTLGSAFVFFLKKDMNDLVQKILLGFAAGVMIAGCWLATCRNRLSAWHGIPFSF